MKKIWDFGIKLKIGIGFTFILLVLIGVQYALNRSISNVISSQEEIIKSTQLSTEVESVKSSVCFFESKMKGFVLTGDDSLLDNNENYLNNIVFKFKKLKQLSPTAEQIASIDTLVSLLNAEIQFSNEIIFQYDIDPKKAVALIKLERGKILMTRIITEFEKIHRIEAGKFADIMIRNHRDSEQVRLMDTSAYVFAFLLVLLCVRILYRDVNKREKLEGELVIAQKKTEEAAAIKEQFMANMSHEIRTPMNAIIGFTSRLSKTKLDEEQQEYVGAVQSSGENLLAIINDVLDFSKIEAGKVNIENIVFNLHDVLNSAKVLFFVQAKEKNISLQLQVSSAVPKTVTGDPTRLNQILVNLIGNALKFTHEGKIDIIVDVINTDAESSHIQFKIKDTGIGISPEKIHEIFDRFTQAKSDTSRIYGGTGLGLSIVKKLVELQGGIISVASEKNKGSEFTVVIPYKKASDLALNADVNKENTKPPVIKDKIKILVVEDNLMNQKLAGFMLKDWGFDFDICANGKLAVEKLKENNVYNLILMDIQMPEMDGYETTEYIRQQLKRTLPIIAMTAHALQEEREKCLKLGMTDYISKPVKEDELKSLILKYLNK